MRSKKSSNLSKNDQNLYDNYLYQLRTGLTFEVKRPEWVRDIERKLLNNATFGSGD
jgi:hypothetical protein